MQLFIYLAGLAVSTEQLFNYLAGLAVSTEQLFSYLAGLFGEAQQLHDEAMSVVDPGKPAVRVELAQAPGLVLTSARINIGEILPL